MGGPRDTWRAAAGMMGETADSATASGLLLRRVVMWTRALLLAATVALFPRAVLAQEGPATSGDASVSMDAAEDATAREVFRRGAQAFAEGRYEEALDAFLESHRLSGRPALLYNIALAHDRLRHDAEALAAYERYLEQADEVQNRAELERRVEVLRGALEDASSHVTSPQVSEEPGGPERAPGAPSEGGEMPSRSEERPVATTRGGNALPWITIAAGVAVAATGGVLFALGRASSSDVENAPDGAAWSEHEDAADRAALFSPVGVGLMAVGAVGLAAGATLLLLGAEEEAERLSASVTPNGLVLAGRFR